MDTSPLRLEYTVPCPPGVAFDLWVQEIGRWWHPDYSPDPQGFRGATIEPWLGGQVLLQDERLGAVPVGTVTDVDPPHRLVHTSVLGVDEQHPTTVTVSFEPLPDGATLVVFEHGGWTAENVASREKFTEWPRILDRYAALAVERHG